MHNKSAEVSIRVGNTKYASVPVQLQDAKALLDELT
jgi:hypothetical protein